MIAALRTRPRPLALVAWSALVLVACAAPGGGDSPAALLATSELERPARLTLEGDRVVAVATPIDHHGLPARAATTVAAIAPDGELRFCGRERGPRGTGFRVEKAYTEPVPHVRSVLVAADGAVLERAHTLPLPDVPQHVLAAALQLGAFVDQAEIVSGPVREEYWRVVVRDRRGRTFVATVGLEGELLKSLRRSDCRVDS